MASSAVASERMRGRDGKVWYHYAVLCWTQCQIAEEFGISQKQVSLIIQKARQEIQTPTREEIIQERIEQIRALNQKFTEQALARMDQDDRNFRDIQAGGLVMQLQQREAKLLGLDAPVNVKADGNLSVTYQIVGVSVDEVLGGMKEITQ